MQESALSRLPAETEKTHFRDPESLFERVQRMAKIGTWTLNVAEDRLEWSAEVFRIFEVDPEAFDGTYESFIGVVHPDDRETVRQAYLVSLETRSPCSLVHRLRMPDGRIKFVRQESDTHFDNVGTPLYCYGTVQDITTWRR